MSATRTAARACLHSSPPSTGGRTARTQLLDPRPAGLRDAPPEIVLDTSASQADAWQAYWSVIDVSGRSARLRQVHSPTPTDHVAEILVVVTVRAGVVTYTPVTMERCGPDLTRLAGGLRRPPAGDPFRPPTGPSEPRPRPDRPTTLDVESGFRRVADPLEPRILSAAALEGARVRSGLSGDAGIPLDIAGALFSRPGFGGGFAGDAHCEVVTAWDVRDRQIWLDARFELRFPVFLGFGNAGPADTVRLPGAGRLGLRARLPILTYRFDAEPVATPTPRVPGPVRRGHAPPGLQQQEDGDEAIGTHGMKIRNVCAR